MPELPEVETVRAGLAEHLVGRHLVLARAHHPRVARGYAPGATDLCDRLVGRQLLSVERRGKYLWMPLDDGSQALLAHLGMSGQFRVTDGPLTEHPHRRFDAQFHEPALDEQRWLTFLDQRTFGRIGLDQLAADSTGRPVPVSWHHVAPDPFEPGFDLSKVAGDIRRRSSEIKRVLLDQTVVSGIGNIYADEALWRARIHPARRADRLAPARVRDLIGEAKAVMSDALAQGGTSFDALYVNVNGESGFFERSLAVYGRHDRPCLRCGAPLRRLVVAARSSFVCLRCQRPPRVRV